MPKENKEALGTPRVVHTVFPGSYSKAQYFHVLLLGLTYFVCVACQRLGLAEEKVVGTWEYPGSDAYSRLVFRRDHVEVFLIPAGRDDPNARKWMPASWGKWRLDGKTIIVSDEEVFGLDGPRVTGTIRRLPIREFYEDRLVIDDDESNLIRLSLIKTRYTRLLSSFYLLACLAVIAVMIVALRKPVSWRRGIVIFIAAICTLSMSILALLAELGGTGFVVISPEWLRWLQVPNDVVKVGLLIILLVVTARLTYRAKEGDRRIVGSQTVN